MCVTCSLDDQCDLNAITNWLVQNSTTLKTVKCKYMLLSRKRSGLASLPASLPPSLPALQPDPQKCTVIGQCLELAETGQQAHFEVHLVDMAGDPCTTEQQVTAELRSLTHSPVTPASVAHKTPDIYEVSYQPNTRGRHKLSVVVNDEMSHCREAHS